MAAGLDRLNQEEFDALLLDLCLPDSQGLDTLSKALENSDHLPIVVLTGQDDESAGRNAVHQGAQNTRMARIDPHRRPQYPPTERMAILELRAARSWSLQQTADAFLVTAATIASWMKRVDEQGPDALLQLREPVNKFPHLVRYVVQRLKTLCPTMGKVKIAQTLARAGLHLGPTTIGRMLKEKPVPAPQPAIEAESKNRVITSKYPNHVWIVDLTTVPTGSGFWCSWLPFAMPQRWPRGSPCAKPWALVAGTPGSRVTIDIDCHAGRKYLPVVKLERAA